MRLSSAPQRSQECELSGVVAGEAALQQTTAALLAKLRNLRASECVGSNRSISRAQGIWALTAGVEETNAALLAAGCIVPEPAANSAPPPPARRPASYILTHAIFRARGAAAACNLTAASNDWAAGHGGLSATSEDLAVIDHALRACQTGAASELPAAAVAAVDRQRAVLTQLLGALAQCHFEFELEAEQAKSWSAPRQDLVSAAMTLQFAADAAAALVPAGGCAAAAAAGPALLGDWGWAARTRALRDAGACSFAPDASGGQVQQLAAIDRATARCLGSGDGDDDTDYDADDVDDDDALAALLTDMRARFAAEEARLDACAAVALDGPAGGPAGFHAATAVHAQRVALDAADTALTLARHRTPPHATARPAPQPPGVTAIRHITPSAAVAAAARSVAACPRAQVRTPRSSPLRWPRIAPPPRPMPRPHAMPVYERCVRGVGGHATIRSDPFERTVHSNRFRWACAVRVRARAVTCALQRRSGKQ